MQEKPFSKINKSFFERESHQVARELLGKNLVRFFANGKCKVGRIVEVEVYQGFDDKASHAFGTKTNRNSIMYGKGGYYYIYLIYGMYHCLNIVTEKEGLPAAVLIRAIEPVIDYSRDLTKLSLKEKRLLGSGPGRLCRWLEIDKSFNGKGIPDDKLYLISSVIPSEVEESFKKGSKRSLHSGRDDNQKSDDKIKIATAKRVGVDYAGKSTENEWRYYIKENKYVSKK